MDLTLGEVLAQPERVPWQHWLLIGDAPWTGSSPCLVADLDGLPEGVDLPPAAVDAGLTNQLDMHSVQSIVENLLQQVSEADLDVRIAAFAYYMENDAFIVLPDS